MINAGLPEVLTRLHLQDSVETARYWRQGTEAEDEDETLLNRQELDQEGQVWVNIQIQSDQEEEAGRE
jgi:hypothetical protein